MAELMAASPAPGWSIRAARADDAPALAALKLATFRETFLEDFAIPYPAADLALFEAESYGEAKVARELADPAHRSWIAHASGAGGADGEMLAYAQIGPCKLPHPEARPGDIELYQIYLRRAAQGAGLGMALLDEVLAAMAAHGGPQWLGVWSGNTRAIAFYRKHGFEIVGEYQFKVGSWRDDERIMRRAGAA